ncbi:MAG TPA: hypothetical protein VFT28_15240 [Gemmatimonadales bacterium]|nr:hypothetical protein [Gemmatimonadales bacterium]
MGYDLGRIAHDFPPPGQRLPQGRLGFIEAAHLAEEDPGEYQIRARGSVAADMADENRWATVRGTFSAEGERGTASAGARSSS